MNSKVLPVTTVAGALAMISSGCENLSPGENAGLFGTVTGLAVGIPLAWGIWITLQKALVLFDDQGGDQRPYMNTGGANGQSLGNQGVNQRDIACH